MSRFCAGVVVGFFRCMLPFSFVLACILWPKMLFSPREWPELWKSMWDEPI